MMNPRKHIEEIRKVKFSIGGELNPLTEDLHHAVKHLSAELYTKDVHFLMELIQNAEDNEYPAGAEPSLEFVITKRDITKVGAPATLLVFNNEKGFSSKNIDSLCSVGRSTKKGNRQGGYIGEKGIGFKSVFLITTQPYIFSNGYRIRFNEVPQPGTKIGYIVPEWVDGKPYIEDIIEVYGGKCKGDLPGTVIILPLRPEKVQAVQEQLAGIHPEVILFMSKIKKLSVREEYNKELVNRVSVSKEISLGPSPDDQSKSFTLHLSAETSTDKFSGECSYYMWRQTFPVKAENRIEGRENVENSVITLAFPREERSGPGIYAFLPTEMTTGFPFIIQADFLLVSSRESIKWDNKWNQGILDCVPIAFCSAFLFLVKSVGSGRPSLSSSIFHKYLPVNLPCYPQLMSLRDAIQVQLKEKEIILCEGGQKYCMPSQARRILPSFRHILRKASEEGLDEPTALWSTGLFIVDKRMEENSSSLQFLGVEYVTMDWYSLCIQITPEWIKNFSEGLYVKLLCFLANNWKKGISAGLKNFPLFKYLTDGYLRTVRWQSLSEISSRKFNIYFSSNPKDISWLTKWNEELTDAPGTKFMPSSTQTAIKNLEPNQLSNLQEWLSEYPKINDLSVSSFSKQLIQEVKASSNKEFAIRVAQFLHFSATNDYLSSEEMAKLCPALPVVEKSGSLVTSCQVKLVPESIGKWPKLLGMNPWAAREFITLSSAYMNPPSCAIRLIGSGENDLKSFICNGLGAVDIPHFTPPDASFPGFSSSVGEKKVLLLLEWIQHLTETPGLSVPKEFKRSLMEGQWLNTHRGYQSPGMSFLFNAQWALAGLQLTDLSFIKDSFYKKSIIIFRSALQQIGVVVDYGEGCEVVEKHLQMHTNLQAITRLYSYLHRFKWRPNNSYSKIWIPFTGGHTGEWKDACRCVVHDYSGLFHGRLEILEKYYETKLLPFFYDNLAVSLHPRIEDYCNLWLDWISTNHTVTETECCLVWKNILQHWIETKELHLRMLVKLPAYASSGHIELCSPTEILIPDDLFLKELFKGTTAKFAWHPNTSDSEIPLDLLFSMYSSIGAQKISQSIQKKEVSVSSDTSFHKLQAGKGLFATGLYRIVLGYLACPSFKLPVDKRHRIVRALLECSLYEATKPFSVVYALRSMTNIKAAATSSVRWEKDNERIFIQTFDPEDPMSKFSFATEFAEAVSKGLLWEYPNLVEGLCEMLKVGCILEFNAHVVSRMLLHKNLQLFEEDESFLRQCFPRD